MTVQDDDEKVGTVVIAYGSNVSPGNAPASQGFANLVKALGGHGLDITKISRLWRSRAWPNDQDPDYVNAVIIARTQLAPQPLLALLHEVERDFGRVRDGRRNVPRPVDLDIIAYDRLVMESDDLVVPHPRAHERAFVMGPLSDIWPDWRHPVLAQTAADLFAAATVGRDAHPLEA